MLKAGNTKLADHNQAGLALQSATTRDNLHCSIGAHILSFTSKIALHFESSSGAHKGEVHLQNEAAQRPCAEADLSERCYTIVAQIKLCQGGACRQILHRPKIVP